MLGVLGGTFVFAGVGVFIALQWSELNAAARVLVTLGSGLIAFVLALLGTRDHGSTRRRHRCSWRLRRWNLAG